MPPQPLEQVGLWVLHTLYGSYARPLLGQDEHNQPGMGMIKLIWENGDELVEMEVSDDIVTADLLELIDSFIRLMGRDPSGELDYVTTDWSEGNAKLG